MGSKKTEKDKQHATSNQKRMELLVKDGGMGLPSRRKRGNAQL